MSEFQFGQRQIVPSTARSFLNDSQVSLSALIKEAVILEIYEVVIARFHRSVRIETYNIDHLQVFTLDYGRLEKVLNIRIGDGQRVANNSDMIGLSK